MANISTGQALGDFGSRDQEGYTRNVTVEATVEADHAQGDVIRLVKVPSNARILNIRSTYAAGTSGAFNLGVYRDGAEGAVADADLFVSTLSIASAVDRADHTNQSTNYGGAQQAQPLWEAAGLTEDPRTPLIIAATVSTVFDGAATSYTLSVDYTTAN